VSHWGSLVFVNVVSLCARKAPVLTTLSSGPLWVFSCFGLERLQGPVSLVGVPCILLKPIAVGGAVLNYWTGEVLGFNPGWTSSKA
ncbi:hypothetical protein Ancab_032143, partial [Ancistrocladus abbreviatus]